MGVDRGAAERALLVGERADGVEDAHRRREDLGADAVAGQRDDVVGSHERRGAYPRAPGGDHPVKRGARLAQTRTARVSRRAGVAAPGWKRITACTR